MDDVIDFAPLAEGPEDDDRERARGVLEKELGWSRPIAPLELPDGVRWLPDLVGSKGEVLLLNLDVELPRVWVRRLRAARTDGREIVLATGAGPPSLDTMLELQRLDARVAVVDLSLEPPRLDRYRSIADYVAREQLYLSPDDLSRLATDRLDAAVDSAHAQQKGRWYEEVLCLVFSQVSWLTVEEHAYHNETEEIDLALAVRAVGHIAGLAGGPLAVATAKNEAKATGSQTVKYLKEQMANRKGRCRLGFLCSATTISAEAHREILRGSQASDQLIVPIDGAQLRALLARPARLDSEVEALLLHASLT